MIRSHLNLSRKSSDANEIIEHLNNECWKLCAACHARNEEKQRNLCDIIVSNIIYQKFEEVHKLRSCALRNFLN